MTRANLQRLTTLALICFAQRLTAQPLVRDSAATNAEHVLLIPGARYAAGSFHRALLGNDYRELWTAPISVPKLDLAHVAGGLQPLQRGGNMRTNSLRFRGSDNREYVFRASQKDMAKGRPLDFRTSLVNELLQDQVSAYNPAAALVVSSLLDATSIQHVRPRLVVMPDDSTLGEFRSDFAGQFGTFEERPDHDFGKTDASAGAPDVISSEKLFERMKRDHQERIDERAYLLARLFDVWVGDRDRHRDQWRWGRFESTAHAPWVPIPRDRDLPFARQEGIALALLRGFFPELVSFGEKYPDMVWLNWNAREIDRRLLTGLPRSAWDAAATELQRQMTDSVIRSAIAEMPPSFVVISGEQLFTTLRARRETLPQAANEFYELLAREVDIRGTDKVDHVTVTRMENGRVRVEITDGKTNTGRGARPLYFTREFIPGETTEIRIMLEGGDDRVVISGARSTDIHVRVIGGDGNDAVHDVITQGDRALSVYDASGDDELHTASGKTIDRRPYTAPVTGRPMDAPRDWGQWSYVRPIATAQAGTGLILGASYTRLGYGFRRAPFAYASTLSVDASVSEHRPRLAWSLDVPRANRSEVIGVDVLASGLEFVRYYGIGNETESPASGSYYRTRQKLYRAEPRWTTQLNKHLSASASSFASYSIMRDEKNTLFSETRPYGSGEFGQVGARGSVTLDTRDSPAAPRRGYRLGATAAFTPSLWSVEHPFASVGATASTYHSAGGHFAPTLALRVGGRHTIGTFPVQEAAQLGGIESLRGFDQQRFSGRSMVYGSAEYRVALGSIRRIVPGRIGVLAFTDVGRVFADHDPSSKWHASYGGGVWVTPLTSQYTMSLSAGRSYERTGIYLAHGFAF